VDDVYGWNFIGGKDGRNVDADTYEVTREFVRLRPIYENIDEKKIKKKQRAEYEYWKKVKEKYERDSKSSQEQLEQYQQYYELYTNAYMTIHYFDSLLQNALGEPVTKSSLSGFQTDNDTLNMAKDRLMLILESVDADVEVGDFLEELSANLEHLYSGVEHYQTAVEFGYNTEFD